MDQIFQQFGNAISGIFSSELVQLALRGIGLYIVILWLATAFWAYQDMKSRTANPILPFLAAALIVAFTPLLFIFAAIVYRIIRPHERVGEAHERMLAEEAMLAEVERLDHCVGCGRRIEDGWMVCPTCRTRLRRVCPSCGKLVGTDWVLCAWCGVDFDRSPVGRPASVGAYAPAGAPRGSRGQPRRTAPPAPAYGPGPAPVAAAAAYGAAQARPAPAPTSSDVAGWPGGTAGAPDAPAARPTSDQAFMATPMASPATASAPSGWPGAAASHEAPAPMEPAPRPAPAAAPAPRPATAPGPSPFRSAAPDPDADDLASLVSDPGPTAPASAPATASSTRSSSGARPRTSTSTSDPASSAEARPASASADASQAADQAPTSPAPAPISGRRAAQR